MASEALTTTSAFGAWQPPAHAAFTALPRETLTMASFAAARGRADAVAEALRRAYGLELPRHPGRVENAGLAVVWAGPDQWLAVAERTAGRDLEAELKAALQGLASVVDQSDGRVVLRIAGPRARDVLAKGIPVDLHPRAFEPGNVAITHASHIGVILWQLDARPTYELALFRSYATSLAHWLDEAAAEFVSSD